VIPDELARDLRYIEVDTIRRIRSLRAGAHTSRQGGDGIDFDQHRPYRPGDDVRHIDWNVTARIGQAFVRRTYAERELDLVVAVDLSRSMRLASNGRSKHETSIRAAASLLFSAVADHIRTGFVAFADRVVRWAPPTASRPRAWAALSELCALDAPAATTALRPVVDLLLRSLKHPTLVVIVSDFLVREDLGSIAELRTLAAHHDVVAVVLSDRIEPRLPAGSGFVRVRDLESGAERHVRLSDAVRRRYAAVVERRRDDLRRCCYGFGIEPVFVDANEDPVPPLIGIFERKR
jgi:uncharacterized protein (DUF58 family)